MEIAALVESVAADEEVADAVKEEPGGADGEDLDRVVHLVVVPDVDERLHRLHDEREAERGQENAHDEHDQHLDPRPAERVLQPPLRHRVHAAR